MLFSRKSQIRPNPRRSRRLPGRTLFEQLESRALLATYSIPLVDSTGLADYELYAVGYSASALSGSSTVGLELVQTPNTDKAVFQQVTSASGSINGIKINRGGSSPVTGGIGRIEIPDTFDTTGAVVLIAAVPTSGALPYVTYTVTGTKVVAPGLPPANNWPGGQTYVYTEIELTNKPGTGLTVDSTQVNFWSMPITIGIDGATSPIPSVLGQPAPLVRTKVFDAYQPFINAETNLAGAANAALRNAYLGLKSGVALVSPLSVLPNTGSVFNTAFDSTLPQLFGGPSNRGLTLRMTGDSGATYTGTPTVSGGSYYLNFVNDQTPTSGQFQIYSPLTPNAAAASTGTSGYQVFGCVGVFKNPVGSNPDALGVGRDIAAALNRGVALLGSGTPNAAGSTSNYWDTRVNWYPAAQVYNNYSRFMHVGQADGANIFQLPPQAVKDAQNTFFAGSAYGFPQDENPPHGTSPYPTVPFKWDPVPAGTTTVTVTLGPWGSQPVAVNSQDFSVQENSANNVLTWSSGPFVGFTSLITATVAMSTSNAGTLTCDSGTNVTVSQSDNQWTLTETATGALNTYFTSGKIKYSTLPNNTDPQQLIVSASAGSGPSQQQSQGVNQITIIPSDAGPKVHAPASFTTNPATPVTLTFPTVPTPFTDNAAGVGTSTPFTVTMNASAGRLTGANAPVNPEIPGSTGVTVTGSGTATMTFAGTLGDLNAYFQTGKLTYTPPSGVATQTLTTRLAGLSQVSTPATTSVFIGQSGTPVVFSPMAFWLRPGQASNLHWLSAKPPFADADSTSLVVTLQVVGGAATLRAVSRAGVAATGSGSQTMTFTGPVRNLNAYFQRPGSITCKAPAGSLLPRTLLVTASDGSRTGSAQTTLLVRSPVASALFVNPATLLGTTVRSRAIEIDYQSIVNKSGATMTGSRSVEFMLNSLRSGMIEVFNNGLWYRVMPMRFGLMPLVVPGGKIRWTPPANALGRVNAFTVSTWDGRQKSGVSQVSFDVTP
ncbi:MAG: beta-1,3-glucanase family protein [Planctomycetota bacterium]